MVNERGQLVSIVDALRGDDYKTGKLFNVDGTDAGYVLTYVAKNPTSFDGVLARYAKAVRTYV